MIQFFTRQSPWLVCIALGMAAASTVTFVATAAEPTAATPSDALTPDTVDQDVPTISRIHVRPLTMAGPLRCTNGIIFDADDRLLVASTTDSAITVLDPDSGEIIEQWGIDDGVVSPDDVAIGPDGSIYWTAILPGHIGKRAPDGTISVIAELGMGVNALRVSPDGKTLYVSKAILGDGHWIVDLTGEHEPKQVRAHSGWSNSMQFGPDRKLYAPLNLYGKVVSYDLETWEMTTVADGFVFPVAVKFNSKGEMFVGDLVTGHIWQVDAADGSRSIYALTTPGVDNLAFDSKDRLFLSNNPNGGIYEVSPTSMRTVQQGGLVAPGGVAVVATDAGERVVVADLYTLREYDPESGMEMRTTGSMFHLPEPPEGEPPYTFDPSDYPVIESVISLSGGDGELISTSWFHNVVQILDPATHEVKQAIHDIAAPLNAIAFGEALVVSEAPNGSVIEIDRETGEQTTLVSGLKLPTGLAATDDDLYVAEWGTGKVLQLIADGELLPFPEEIADGLRQPEGMTIDLDGALLVVESGAGVLTRIDVTTRKVSEITNAIGSPARGLPSFPPSHALAGVAVASDGTIYVSADGKNQVLQIRRG